MPSTNNKYDYFNNYSAYVTGINNSIIVIIAMPVNPSITLIAFLSDSYLLTLGMLPPVIPPVIPSIALITLHSDDYLITLE